MSTRDQHTAAQHLLGASMGMRGCESHVDCASNRPGHGLHAMQERLASVAASKWDDVIVSAVDADGFIEVVSPFSSEATRVWHHEPLIGRVAVGEPVALHSVYGVLAVGAERLSVAAA
ncbi:MAG TPA: hypothetical protein VFU07_02590 [Candidatus Lumbricidophila sp.]|nr:hypothetical protein [Candidatus Lumbricidophila sp.]